MSRLERGLPGEQIVRNTPVNTGRVGIGESLAAPGLASPPPVSRGVTLANQLQSALGSAAQAVHLAGRVSASERRDQQEQQRLTNLALRGQASQSAKETQPALLEAIENGDIRFDDAGGTDETINALIARETEGLGEAYTTAFSNAIKPALVRAFTEQQTREQDKNREAAHQYAIDLGGAGSMDEALQLSVATGTDERTARLDIGSEALLVAVANRDPGLFDQAAGFLGTLDPSFVAQQRAKLQSALESDRGKELAGRVRDVRDKHGEMLNAGRYDAAIALANKADIPGDDKDALVQEAKARKAQALEEVQGTIENTATQGLIRMDSQGASLDEMREFLNTLPVRERDAQAMLRKHAKSAIQLASELGRPDMIERWEGGLNQTREDQAFLVRQKEEAERTKISKEEAIIRKQDEARIAADRKEYTALAADLFLSQHIPGGINNFPLDVPDGVNRQEAIDNGLRAAFAEIDNRTDPTARESLIQKAAVMAGHNEKWKPWMTAMNAGLSAINADGEVTPEAVGGFALWREIGSVNAQVRKRHVSPDAHNFYQVAEELMNAQEYDEGTALANAMRAWARFDGNPPSVVSFNASVVENAAKDLAGDAVNFGEVRSQVVGLANSYLWTNGISTEQAIKLAKNRWKEQYRIIDGFASYVGDQDVPANLDKMSLYASYLYANENGEALGITQKDIALKFHGGTNRWILVNKATGRPVEGSPALSPAGMHNLEDARLEAERMGINYGQQARPDAPRLGGVFAIEDETLEVNGPDELQFKLVNEQDSKLIGRILPFVSGLVTGP